MTFPLRSAFLGLFIFALFVSAGLPFAVHAAKKNCQADLSSDDSLKSGILMHGEHWVDLILRQAGTADPRPLKVFEETLAQLMNGAQAGGLPRVNEKIDGSPSVVFGFDGDGKPFIAYKGHFSKKAQTLVRNMADAATHFKRSPALQKIFSLLFAVAEGPLKKTKRNFANYIFQGDLLFVEGDDRRQITEDAVTIQANSVAYRIAREHALFAGMKSARAGIVFHTVGQRVVEEDGRMNVRALADSAQEEELVRAFAKAIHGPGMFVMDPWHDNVVLGAKPSPDVIREVAERIAVIKGNLSGLSPQFRAAWSGDFEAKWRTFFNSGLRPPHDGGFYKIAATGEPVDAAEWMTRFAAWLRSREEDALAAKFESFAASENAPMQSLIAAYASAVAIQYKIQPYLKEALVSKLGGGEVEGLMLKTEDSVVKWVDRLEFTLRNNARWNRGAQQAPVAELNALPFPLNEWRAGASFLVMKGQPIHAGHIEMIRAAAAQNPAGKIFVLASDKQPNLAATEWRDLKAADTKKDLLARKYTYIFDNAFREKLLLEGLSGSGAEVTIVNPGLFWSYVRTAVTQNFAGKVKLVVGEKEIAEGRYDMQLQELGENLELQPMAMKVEGLSATQVRAALKDAALGVERTAALATLNRAFAYIADEMARRRAIEEAVEQWRRLDEVAQRLVGTSPNKKAVND